MNKDPEGKTKEPGGSGLPHCALLCKKLNYSEINQTDLILALLL